MYNNINLNNLRTIGKKGKTIFFQFYISPEIKKTFHNTVQFTSLKQFFLKNKKVHFKADLPTNATVMCQ